MRFNFLKWLGMMLIYICILLLIPNSVFEAALEAFAPWKGLAYSAVVSFGLMLYSWEYK